MPIKVEFISPIIFLELIPLSEEGVDLDREYAVRSLERASEILSCFTLYEPEKSLKQLSEETGLPKSTVFRLLDTMERIKWVRRDPRVGTYRVGFGIFELGTRAIRGNDFYQVSLFHLEKLVKLTEQSAHLVIQDQGEVLYLNKVEAPGSLIAQPSQIGLRFPMHCTAVGKVLLSFMEEKYARAIIAAKGLKKMTRYTIVEVDDLLREAQSIRQKGYAIDNEEIQLGLRCVAAPIKDFSGKVIAAISVSGLVSNLSDHNLPYIIEQVIHTAGNISSDLGCRTNPVRE